MRQRPLVTVLLVAFTAVGTAVVAGASNRVLLGSAWAGDIATLPSDSRRADRAPGVVPSGAVPPPSAKASPMVPLLSGPITNQAGVDIDLRPAIAAIDRLRCRTGTRLYAVFVPDTANVDIDTYEQRVADANDDRLSSRDALLIVATDARRYVLATEKDLDGSVSQAELDAVATQWVRPRLHEDDWTGAIEAAAAGIESAILGDVRAGPPASPVAVDRSPTESCPATGGSAPPDLPFTFDAPAGWSWSPVDRSAVGELGSGDPLRRWLDTQGWDPTIPMARWVATPDGLANVVITWVQLPGACAPATALEVIERQNAEAVRTYPGLVDGPSVGRAQLADGDAVRITWTGRVPADGPRISAVGFGLVVGDVLYTIVVSQPADVPPTVAADVVAAGFRAHPGGPAGPLPGDVPGLLPSPLPDTEREAIPHQAPELEALLPCALGGRMLSRWSLRGIDYFEIGGVELSAIEVAQLTAALQSMELSVDDVAYAIDGRSDTAVDPPWFVTALRFGDLPAGQLPPTTGIDHPDAGAFETITLGGTRVLRGPASLMEQSEHLRGRPYILDVGTVRFMVVTEDEAWAAEAIADLTGSAGS